MLAIVWATKYFRPYLFGRKFKIITDHRPLQWIMSLKEPNSKLVRWRLKLEEFDYIIEHKKGTMNSNADALSRIPIEINNNESVSSTGATAHSADSDNNDLIPISESALNNFKNQVIILEETSGSASIQTLKVFNNVRKIIKLKEFNEEIMVQIYKNHFHPKQLNAVYIEDIQLFLEMQEIYKKHFSRNKIFKVIRCTKFVKDLTDEHEQDDVIKEYHINSNHRGINESYEHLKRSYFFPNLKAKIQININHCQICQEEKYERRPQKIKYEITETPKQPLEIIHIDIFFMKKGVPTLTLIDKFSRYAQAYVLESRNSPHIKSQLLKYFSTFGKPKLIVSDQEKAITSLNMQEFLKTSNIKVHFTSVNSSNSNSPVERFHSTLSEHLRIIINNENVTYEEALNRAIHAYNNSIHKITNYTPFELFFGRKQDEPLETDIEKIKAKKIELQTNAYNNSLKNKIKYINKRNENRDDAEDDLPNEVFMRIKPINKLQARNKKIKIISKDRLHVKNIKNKKLHKKNISKIRKFVLQRRGQMSSGNTGHN